MLIVNNIDIYKENTDWLLNFGNPIVSFSTLNMFGNSERRALYDGFLDVDFTFLTPDDFYNLINNNDVLISLKKAYKFLVDKDGYNNFIITEKSIQKNNVINNQTVLNEIYDYWYNCIWLSKKILRDELWTAVRFQNSYFSNKLLYMIETYEQIKNNFSTETWYGGRHLEKWVDYPLLKRLKGCFTDYDKQGIIKSLYQHINLYYDISFKVTDSLKLNILK